MRTLLSFLAVMFVATSAFAADPAPATTGTHGEFANHCAWGLTQGKQVATDCHINWKDAAGKTYCFSSEEAKTNWSKDTTGNMAKATTEYTKTVASNKTTTNTMTK